jgi:hypothetical protein
MKSTSYVLSVGVRIPTPPSLKDFRNLSEIRRLAIRAARFEPEADCLPCVVTEKNTVKESHSPEKRGDFKGTIRILLHSLSFLFNALAFPHISSNSLKFRPVLFSTPTRFRQLICREALTIASQANRRGVRQMANYVHRMAVRQMAKSWKFRSGIWR